MNKPTEKQLSRLSNTVLAYIKALEKEVTELRVACQPKLYDAASDGEVPNLSVLLEDNSRHELVIEPHRIIRFRPNNEKHRYINVLLHEGVVSVFGSEPIDIRLQSSNNFKIIPRNYDDL